jgi:hypothetical protein
VADLLAKCDPIWYHLGGWSDEGDTYDTQLADFEEQLNLFWADVIGFGVVGRVISLLPFTAAVFSGCGSSSEQGGLFSAMIPSILKRIPEIKKAIDIRWPYLTFAVTKSLFLLFAYFLLGRLLLCGFLDCLFRDFLLRCFLLCHTSCTSMSLRTYSDTELSCVSPTVADFGRVLRDLQ